MGGQQVVELLFAGKGWVDHVRGVGNDNAVDRGLAGGGLVADAIGTAQMVAPYALKAIGKPGLAGSAATPIIGAALLSINAVSLTLGFEDPETGHRFEQGASKFKDIHDTLESGFPTDDWVGDGSQAYTRQNERQQIRAEKMSSVDAKIKGIIAQQARQVTITRRVLDGSATGLTACIPSAIALGLTPVPPVGLAPKTAFETSVSAIALAAVSAAMQTMMFNQTRNAFAIKEAMEGYTEVSQDSKPSGSSQEFNPPPGTTNVPKPSSESPSMPGGTGSSGGTGGIGSIGGGSSGGASAGAGTGSGSGGGSGAGGGGIGSGGGSASTGGGERAPAQHAPGPGARSFDTPTAGAGGQPQSSRTWV